MAVPIILPFNSAHPMRTKKAVLTAELKRAVRVSSDQTTRERSLSKMKNLFEENGYPPNLIQKKTQELSRPTQRHTTNAKDNTYVTLPFVDDQLARKVEGAIRTSGLPLRPAWSNKNTLKHKLVRSSLESPACPGGKRCHACKAGLKGQCTSKNVVYQITCQICAAPEPFYIGETKRHIRLRFNEHRRNAINKTQGTPFGDHMSRLHPNEEIGDQAFQVKIIRRCRDGADRKIAEAVTIKAHNPTLNTVIDTWPLV